MTNPLLPTFSGPLGNALTSSSAFVDLLETRDPTPFDSGYPVQKKWLNTVTNNLWYLKNFTSTTGQVLANWILISSSIVAIEKLQGNTGGAVSPDGSNIIHTVGDGIGITVAGNPGTNTLTWSLVGGGNAIEKFIVDAFTAPGTNPVAPTNLGLVTVTGGQVAAGTTGNVIQTNSLAANTYTIQVQRSQAVAVSTIADNGVCHFDSAAFPVDANAFVQFPTTHGNSGTAYPSGTALNVIGTGTISTAAAGNTVTISSVTGSTAFFAFPTGNITLNAVDTTPVPITFNTTDFNIGGAYSTGTGLFTAPATGLYSFQCTINLTNTTGLANTPSLYFNKNGGAGTFYRFTEMNFGNPTTQANEGYTGSVTLRLTSGDTVGLAVGDNPFGQIINFTIRGQLAGPLNLNYFSGIRLT